MIKESVLGCLLDCLPAGVNRERISSATLKEAYVQKMVKVFNEYDRWSLISLSNNSGKNLELKFVSMLRRQFEFSVDSFQIILDRLLESYMQQESQHRVNSAGMKDSSSLSLSKDSQLQASAAESEKSDASSSGEKRSQIDPTEQRDEELEKKTEHSNKTEVSTLEMDNKEKTPTEFEEHKGKVTEPLSLLSNEKAEQTQELSGATGCSSEQTDREQPAQSSPTEPAVPLLEQSSDSADPAHPQDSQSNGHSDETHSCECSTEDQRGNESALDAGTSSHAKMGLEDEGEVETVEPLEANQSDPEVNQITEDSLAAEAKHNDRSQSIDCLCTVSSFPSTLHDTQDTHTAGEPTHTLDAANPADTQETSPTAPGVLPGKKTSSPPPSKTSERLSHMVVLKHSSPTPPRRMCRKVTASSCPGAASCVDPSPGLSAEPDIVRETSPDTVTTSDTSVTTAIISPEKNPDADDNLSGHLDLSAPDVTSTSAVDPAWPPEPPAPPLVPEDPIQSLKQTLIRTDSLLKQSDILDSLEPADTSELKPRDEDQTGESHSVDPPNNPTETCSPPSPTSVSPTQPCLTPPVLSFSPPPSLTPPSHCLSISPSSSCLSSPPFLTPPMLSLSPPPFCLNPAPPCLSPPMESDDLIAQVSPDMEPLVRPTEEQSEETSTQPGLPVVQLEKEEKEQDYLALLPQVSEPVSFPITIPGSDSHELPPSQSAAVESPAPGSTPENKEAYKITAVAAEQRNLPQATDSVPAVEVLAESMYGDFEAAMDHLRYRLIATRNPEEIRGGGLLKYSNLLVRDYRPASETQIKTLERYMCSRFFIDFPDVQEQQRKILSYLKNHFIGEERSKYQYLMTLRRVVDNSTVCLMGHERRQTLNMITVLALKVLGEQNIIPNTDHVTCFYQPAPYLAEHSAPYIPEPSYCSYYIPQGGSTLLYQPYPLHLHPQTGLV